MAANQRSVLHSESLRWALQEAISSHIDIGPQCANSFTSENRICLKTAFLIRFPTIFFCMLSLVMCITSFWFSLVMCHEVISLEKFNKPFI